MKSLSALVLVALACGFTGKTTSSLLWKVEGKGIKPAYLFGTIHLLPQADFELKDTVKAAFTLCEKLVLELDMDDPGMFGEMMANMSMKGDSTLNDLLSQEDYDKLAKHLFDKVKIPLETVSTHKPFTVATYLTADFIEGTPASFENEFVQLALQQQKEILGLETVTEQLSIFDSIPYVDQAESLMEMVSDGDEMKVLFREIVDTYKTEDIDQLERVLRGQMDSGLEYQLLVEDRNHRWVGRIAEKAAQHTCFFAVGAGHLGGEHGMVKLLREAGYTVTAVVE